MHNGMDHLDGMETVKIGKLYDYVEGYANGPTACQAGDEVNYAGNTYWTDRHFLERTIQNYNGSIYFIHGMQDWNVDPHMAFLLKQLQQAGFEIKGLFGQ